MRTLKLISSTLSLWVLCLLLIYVAMLMAAVVLVAAIPAAPIISIWCAWTMAKVVMK